MTALGEGQEPMILRNVKLHVHEPHIDIAIS